MHLKTADLKSDYLRAYTRTYLKEEILQEQIVRNIDPFQNFLEIAAQANSRILNYSKISKDLGVDDKTVKNYFSILVDTYLGFYLYPFHRSIRKRQRESPKFYFFDLGIKRATERKLTLEIQPQSYEFGDAFETWIIQECFRYNEYYKKDFRFSYLRTQNNVEIDLIIERPGKEDLLVEIKSATKIGKDDIRSLVGVAKDWDQPCKVQLWSQDKNLKNIEGVVCLYWQTALKDLFLKM